MKTLIKDALKNFQANNRARLQSRIGEEVIQVQNEDIVKTAAALLEVGVDENKIRELLIKYWDLRPSESISFINKATKK